MRVIYRICCVFLWIAVTHGFAQDGPTIEIGDKPPDLDMAIVSDNTIGNYSWDHLQGKAVFLDFWATWCGPCIKSIPHMNNLVQEFEDRDVVFISVSYEPPKVISDFLRKYPMQSIVATDTSFGMFKAFDAWAIPVVVLVNREGNFVGRIHPEHLTAAIVKTVLQGEVPEVEQTPYHLYEPEGAEDYFRSFLK